LLHSVERRAFFALLVFAIWCIALGLAIL